MIKTTRQLSLTEILKSLNIHPTNPNSSELCYLSPIRNEKTPSFYVNAAKNVWHDHGTGKGGGVLQFAQAYLEFKGEEHNVPDALRWLDNFSFSTMMREIKSEDFKEDTEQTEAILRLKVRKPITVKGLIHYLNKRGIPLELGREYLEEVYVYNKKTRNNFIALAFPNEEEGLELRNPFFKGCLKPKAISFIRGRTSKPDSIHIFEGFMDYLSAITQLNGRKFKGDAIVLNSLSLVKKALPYIHNYGYRFAYTWLDNDDAGDKAQKVFCEFFKAEDGITHIPMNKIYAPFKDVNEWHMNKLGL